jgi:hypothetical protein
VKPEEAPDMKPCKYDSWIDRYLLNKLRPEDQAEFEEHYFLCPHCFAKLDQQSEIVQILKKEGVLDTYQVARCSARRSLWRRLFGKRRQR